MKRIDVTKAFLPPIEEYYQYLQQIWQNNWLTNNGPLLNELEDKLKGYLDVQDFHLVTNGTIALQLALRALDIADGEVITTPFSYVATTSSILWENCQPVFVDIEPETFCIDPAKIEAAITGRTRAIMPVHVFGNPCDTEKIEAIAKKHNLKVIYDGAHTFGARYKGKSLLDYGDISVCSFHATKLFQTIEGGCVIARDKEVSERVELLKRFGHTGDDHFILGINAKASEFQAAMGLAVLKHIRTLIAARKRVTEQYNRRLKGFIRTPIMREGSNYAYYPVVLESETQLKAKIKQFAENNIFPRRYFYPSLNTLPYLSDPASSCPISEDIASRIICLPLFAGLEEKDVDRICAILKK